MQTDTKRAPLAAARPAALMGLALLTIAASTPLAAQDLTQRERQRLFSQVKPAIVLIFTAAQAQITIPRPDNAPLVLEAGIAGSGSGWIMTPDGFVATNGHVVRLFHESNEDELRAQLLHKALDEGGVFDRVDEETGRPPTEAEAIRTTLELLPLADIAIVKDLKVVLQNGRVLDGTVREYSPPIFPVASTVSLPGRRALVSGRDVAILKVAGRDFPTMTLGDSDRSAIGEQVFVAGYPGAADIPSVDEASVLEASFTSGQISALKVAVGGSDLIQADAAAGPGNSGGPVFNRNGEVLGMLTMGEGESFNFAVTANTVREFFRSSGAVAGESLFDRTWNRALDAYYSGSYAAAVNEFDEALRVMPDLPDALNLRRIAMSEREAGNTAPPADSLLAGTDRAAAPMLAPAEPDEGSNTWLLGIMALGVILVGAGIFVRRQPATAGGAPAPSSGTAGGGAATLALPSTPATLRVSSGPLSGNTFPVEPGGLRIGRDPASCQIVLSEASVSREHAVIRPNGGSLSIKNLSGTNPTFVNDRAIQEATLSTGDEVKIGDSVFKVEA